MFFNIQLINGKLLQMHEKAEEAIAEQSLADILYLTENEGRLRLDTYTS